MASGRSRTCGAGSTPTASPARRWSPRATNAPSGRPSSPGPTTTAAPRCSRTCRAVSARRAAARRAVRRDRASRAAAPRWSTARSARCSSRRSIPPPISNRRSAPRSARNCAASMPGCPKRASSRSSAMPTTSASPPGSITSSRSKPRAGRAARARRSIARQPPPGCSAKRCTARPSAGGSSGSA